MRHWLARVGLCCCLASWVWAKTLETLETSVPPRALSKAEVSLSSSEKRSQTRSSESPSLSSAQRGLHWQKDPYERFNRRVFQMNRGLDRWIFRPMASGYKTLVPQTLRTGVSNVYDHLALIPWSLNALFQGEVRTFYKGLWRFGINSTLGLLGTIDVASSMGLTAQRSDFGLTLARWSGRSEASPYLVLPILGPSTFRDFYGRIIDFSFLDPTAYLDSMPLRYRLVFINMLQTRAALLDLDRVLHEAAFDRYALERDAYLQNRRKDIVGETVDSYVPDDEEEGAGSQSSPLTSEGSTQ